MVSHFAPHSVTEKNPKTLGTNDKTATNDSNLVAITVFVELTPVIIPPVLKYLVGAAALSGAAGWLTSKLEKNSEPFLAGVAEGLKEQSGLNLTPLPKDFTVTQLEKYSPVPQIPTQLSGLNLNPITVSFANNQAFQDTRWISNIPRDSDVTRIIHSLALTLAQCIKNPCKFNSFKTNGTLGNLKQRIDDAKDQGIDTDHPEGLRKFLKDIFDKITPNKENPSPCGGDQDQLKEKLQKALNGIKEYVDGLHERRAVLLEKLKSEQPPNQ